MNGMNRFRYNDERRIKYTINSVTKMDYASGCNALLDKIARLNRGESDEEPPPAAAGGYGGGKGGVFVFSSHTAFSYFNLSQYVK